MTGVPLVSVVIPTADRARFLAEAIASVERQSHESIECIVVDDASTDGTESIVADRAHSGIDLRYIRLADRLGRGAARNAGLRLARGSYVLFLDDDDLLEPDGVSRLLAAACSRGLPVALGEVRVTTEDGSDWYARLPPSAKKLKVWRDMIGRWWQPVTTGCLLIDRELCLETGGFLEDATAVPGEDNEFVLRLGLATPFAVTALLVLTHRRHQGSTSRAGVTLNLDRLEADVFRRASWPTRNAARRIRSAGAVAATAAAQQSSLSKYIRVAAVFVLAPELVLSPLSRARIKRIMDLGERGRRTSGPG